MTSSADTARAVTLALALLLPRAAVAGAAPEPPAALRDQVAEQVAAAWAVPAAELRLQWGRVPADAPFASTVAARLAGRGADGWFAVVLDGGSCALRVRAGVERPVPVAARPLMPGETLRAADVRLEPRVAWGPPAAPSGACAGWRVRRALAAGDPLIHPAVTAPALIEAGAPVTAVWVRGPVRVTRPAVALHAARAGQTVRLRAEGASGRLSGTAVAPGLVTLSEGGRP